MRDKETKKFIKRTSIIGIMLMIVAAFVMSLVHKEDILDILSDIYNVISPILLGLIIAYIVNFIYVKVGKICNKLIKNNKNIAKIISIIISETIAIGIIVTIIIAIIPSLVENIKKILYELPNMVNNTQDWVNNFLDEHKSIKNIVGDHSDLIQSKVSEFIADYDVTPIMNRTVSLVSETFTYTLNIVVALVINVMVLINKETMMSNAKKTIRAIFGKKCSKYIIEEIRVVDKKFSGFLIGKIVDSLIIGILAFIGVSLLGIDYAALIAFIIGVTNIIPIIGPFIGAVPCAVIVLGQSPKLALYFMIFVLILQQIDGNIIGPKCIGSSTNVNSFWVLSSLIIFGSTFGLVGMLIGVPVIAVILDLWNKLIDYRLNKDTGDKKEEPVKVENDKG